eukprot:CAMPEP_0119119378 /NCGR_PEP_ID=MMETSP1310-20130426/893_1 /TAXON_ID=464262 /ORGANISM="Genus nov. species nov., Strain RCC2339" /LENGTH=442 /DNA_ID=CAMNT_0007108809 /DNA_START=75 /DNA_END=1403 /DNA_ORIENTATION=+
MKFVVIVTLALLAVGCVSAQTRDDYKIVDLPGIPEPATFDMYSGYITLDNGVKLFFYLSESQSNPSTDPLILWLNGGPGCSSLLGAFMENGPYQAGPDGETLVAYPWSWNTRANIVFLESPAFVGFSYWPDHGKWTTQGTDNTTALYNREFLEKFLGVFTEYQNRPFVISGESYAGKYIPELLTLLLSDPIPGLNFQGVAIGNPYVDADIDNGPGLELYRRGHFLKTLSGEGTDYPNGIDPYDILASTCGLTQALFPNVNNGFQWGKRPYDYAMEILEKEHEGYVPNPLPDCVANGFTKAYLNRADVQAAMHAERDWDGPCSNSVFVNWRGRVHNTVPLIEDAMDNSDLTIWIYSGDQDTVCNAISTEQWILGLNRPEIAPYQTWLYTQAKEGVQVGGFQLSLDRLTWRSVRGAGHEVPRLQPGPALQLLDDFLAAVAKEHN